MSKAPETVLFSANNLTEMKTVPIQETGQNNKLVLKTDPLFQTNKT